MKLSPMFQQYARAKAQHPDALLFFRLGDFYELFFEDAEKAARLLDLTLTTRSKKDENQIPMCGVPHHSVQPYVARLLAAGLKVALCEQMEDPSQAKGLVSRQVVRVLTPGTVTEEDWLDPRRANYLAALCRNGAGYILALAELSTGETAIVAAHDAARLGDELARFTPAEILVPADDDDLARLAGAGRAVVSALDASRFQAVESGAEPAFGALRWYLEQTHRASLEHLRPPARQEQAQRLVLDETSQRNLELLQTSRGERRGSLLWVLDDTSTAMGSRLLRAWMLAPLTDLGAIGQRLDAVEALLGSPSWREDLRRHLGAVGDLERLVGRLASRRVGPRDLLGVAAALERVGRVRALLQDGAAAPVPSQGPATEGRTPPRAALLSACAAHLEPLPELRDLIARSIADEPPALARAGGAIRSGYDADVDELRELSRSGKSGISQLEAAERQRTGIASLKVRYNQVFGYYIEVTKANLHLVPPDFHRKQTLAGVERYATPALEEYERKVLGAEDRLHALEARLFDDLVGTVASHQHSLAASAAALAQIDVVAALAAVAEKRRYTRPRLTQAHGIDIRDGRHPVVEAVLDAGAFVPNDCRLDPEGPQIVVLTGPNMAGKSTYLRQVALIVLLAQMGSFVPAAEAEIGLVDRVFTRVGAADNLAGGESTFMVEMRETAHILEHLTQRSLVVLDEIGRGTSTFDGISIAWAVAEHLHDNPALRALVLFATHYHELTDLARTQARVANASVAVREWKGEVIFLRRIVPQPASRSYGIEVAKLAGVPPTVIERAREILRNLESGELTEAGQPRLAQHGRPDTGQLALFAAVPDPVRSELADLDVDRMTPLEALTRLHELVEKARR